MGELSELDMPPSAAMPSSFQHFSRAVKTEAGVSVPVPVPPPSSSFSSPSSSSSSCPSPSPSSSSVGGNEQFPVGMRVLLVDDDRTCLKILSQMLCRCNYQVTPCSKATDALALLRSNWGGYDMVISDVYMPDMDGFKLLELVGLEMDLPVIMMSANGDTGVVMKGITHGACDYLLKPVRMEELRNIWQHIVRRKRDLPSSADEERQRRDDHRSPLSEGPDATGGSYRHSKKRKEGSMMAEEEEEDEEHEGEELAGGAKKARVVWSVDLHQQFVNAVNQLGIDKAVPKRILELMNVPGLTRENVASHLQKYRLYLKRISGVSSEAGGGLTNNPPPPPSSTLGDLQALAAAVQLSPQALSSTLLHQLSLPNALGAALTTDPALLHHLASMQAGGSNSSTITSVLSRTPFGQPSGRLPELNPTHNALLMQYLQQSYRLPSIGSHVSANEVGTNGLPQLKSNSLPSNLLSSNLTLPYELGSNGLPLPLLKPNPPPSNILSSNPSLSYEVGSNGLPQLKSSLLGLNPTSLPYEVGSNGLPQLKSNQSPSNLLGLNPTSLPYELSSNGLPQLKPNPPPSNLLSLNPTLPYEVGSNGLPLLKPNPPASNLLSSNPSLSYDVGCNDLPHLKRNSSLTNLIGSNPTLPYEVGSNDLPQLKGNSSLTNLLGSNPTLPFEVGSNGFPQLKPNPPLSNLLRSNSTLSYEGGSNDLPELRPNPSPSNLLSSNPTSLPYASLASSEVESEGGFNPIYSPNMAANGMTKLSQYTTSNPNSSNHLGWQALGLHHNVRQSTTATSPLASPRCHDIGSFGSSVNNDQMQAWATTPFASHNGSNSGNTTTSSRQSKPSFGHILNRYEQPSIVEAGNESKIEEGSHDLLVGSRTSYTLMPETFSTSDELMTHMLLKQRQDGFSESDFVGGNIGLNNMYVK